MLIKLKLHNFMSYSDTTVSFKKTRVALIIGDVGSGKSALLESLLYVFYGYLRVQSISEAITLTSKTQDMYVKLLFKVREDQYVIIRGRRASGTGYVTVEKNGKLEAKGRASKKYIEELLGMNDSIFRLTSFFGVGEIDELMEALPSQRLETLQKVAKVDKYVQYHKIASSKLSKCDTRIGVLKELLNVDEVDYKEEILRVSKDLLDKKSLLSETTSVMQKLFQKRDRLISESKTIKALSEELTSLEVKISSEKSRMNEKKEMFKTLKKEEVEYTNKISRLVSAIKEKESMLRSDINQIKSDKEETERQIEKDTIYVDLINMGTTATGNDGDLSKCPLCSHKLESEMLDTWKKRSDMLLDSIEVFRKDVLKYVVEIKKDQALKSEIENAKVLLGRARSALKRTQHVLSVELDKQEKSKSNVSLTVLRYDKVKEMLTPLKEANKGLQDIYDKLQYKQRKVGALQEGIKTLEIELKDIKVRKVQRSKYKRELANLKRKSKALALLTRAYSRYGIPLDMTHNLVDYIQEEATRLYKYFDDGRISIEEKSYKGLPGLDFALVDMMGRRSYKQLSKGQRALLSLTIRIAISLILRKEFNIEVDFLVLDEIASNLDPSRRDSLVRIACLILKKHYKQIFMMSHVRLKDIFSDIYRVWLDNGHSVLEKL